ncbi:MAG: hypothetical protein AAB433_05090 [Nitrospirota bacterium]
MTNRAQSQITAALLSLWFLSVGIVFLFSQMHASSKKAFWLDESYAMTHMVRAQTYQSMIAQGLTKQGSPAPLDYLALKAWDSLRRTTGFMEQIPDLTYYRLPALIYTLIPYLLMCTVVVRKVIHAESRPIVISIVSLSILIPFSYLYMNEINYYAREMRPYALWNALFSVSLILTILRTRGIWLAPILVLLSLTATAALFQLLSLCAATITCGILAGEQKKQVWQEAAGLFAAPIILSIFYCLKVEQYGYDAPTWSDFAHFYVRKLSTCGFLTIVLIAASFHQAMRRQAAAILALLIMFSLGPVVFWLTLQKGFFFTSRQYLYYDLAGVIPLFFVILHIERLQPMLKKLQRPIALMLIVILAIALPLTFRLVSFQTLRWDIGTTRHLLLHGFSHPEETGIPLPSAE